MSHVKEFFSDVVQISNEIDKNKIEHLASELNKLRESNGRLFVIGVGGSAANASHAVNDFRKLCNIESYSPSDNIAELTARINDEGWDSSYSNWLKCSKINNNDALFVFSVGGGNLEKNVSTNLIEAIKLAKSVNARILGIVGRDGGYAYQEGNVVLLIPVVQNVLVTPYSESFQAVVWHCLVSHPLLQICNTKW